MTKKRLFASVLALFLLLSCAALPTPAYAEGAEAPSNGLELSKKVTPIDDNTFTITMESYTTGTVTSSTKTVPVDIVLVLDQSGSMSDAFGSTTRQAAMKTGVNNFIAAVAEKYSDEADHRMAIVTFGSSAKTLQGWTFVDATGKNTLQGRINGLPASINNQATNVAAGMSQAETLMGSGYNYTGTNTPRQKVVIVFTDGVPTTSSDFDTTVATNAIASANRLKNIGVTVYSVGIFTGADPNQLYGASGFDRNCNGTVGSDWSDFSVWMIGDIQSYDVPAGNRFLNYLSSNFASATEIGIKKYSRTFFGIGYRGWEITKNFERTASSYYLTANDSASLNGIFKTISENIQNANINLGSETVVKDTVTQYFDLPANNSDIKVYTADAKADGTFGEREVAKGVTPDIKDHAVTVTGFDFNANFVTKDKKKDGTYGKKLIIEFTVTRKTDFIGGNDVPTNDWENTGVYDKTGALVENFNNATNTPKVNVPIKEPDFTANNKTIYLGNSTEVSGLYTLADTTGWQYDYVDVVKGVEGVTGTTVSPVDCTGYEITVTFKPESEGTEAVGEPNSMAGVSKTDKATVHVLKPNAAVTLNDVSRFYGESYTLGADNNAKVSLEWKDMTADHTTIPAAEGTAPYTKDELTVAYEAQGITVTGNQFTVPKDDVTITVKLMNGNKQVTDATITTTCSLGCEPTSRKDGTYIVHVKTATLTITKSGMKSGENALFVVTGEGLGDGLKVSVPNGGSVTVSGLCVGADYTVTEDTGWSSCYTAAGLGTVTMDEDGETMSVTNALKTDKTWLRGEATANNVFNKVES